MGKRAVVSPGPVGDLIGSLESLCDPVRLRLLRLIEDQELGVAELCRVLQLPQSTVSRHLKQLSGRGWVVSRRAGTANLYRMMVSELDDSARRLWRLARERVVASPSARQDQLRLARQLRERSRRTDSFFAGAAGRWDQMRDEAYGTGFTTAAVQALLPPWWVVADLGCGTGVIACSLAPHVDRVIGVDRSRAMLDAASERARDLHNVDLRQGDLEALPLAGAEIDAALLVIVLTYVVEPAAVLREAARALRPGGRLVVVDLLRHEREAFRRRMGQRWPGFEAEHLCRLLAAAGLIDVRCNPLQPEPQASGPALLLASARRPDDVEPEARNGR